MKKLFWVYAIFFSLILVSCRHAQTYSFLNPADEISEISIVQLSFGDDGLLIETEIQKIEDTAAFLDDFQKTDCYIYFGDPAGATPEGVEDIVIKIMYKNLEYELINWNGQSFYTYEKGFVYYAGYSIFDEKEFESLIEKFRQTDN